MARSLFWGAGRSLLQYAPLGPSIVRKCADVVDQMPALLVGHGAAKSGHRFVTFGNDPEHFALGAQLEGLGVTKIGGREGESIGSFALAVAVGAVATLAVIQVVLTGASQRFGG